MIKKYTEIDFQSFLSQFPLNKYFIRKIPIEYFECNHKNIQKSFKYIANFIENESKLKKKVLITSLSYNKKYIMIKEVNRLMKHGYFQLDYMEREKFIPFVYDVNVLIPRNGCLIHYVSNIPNYLDSVLYFECNDVIFNQLKEIANYYDVVIDTSKKLEDFIYQQVYRQWDGIQFFPSMSKEEIKEVYLNNFRFKSNLQLKKEGFDFDKKVYKPKIFISYCWNNKEPVREFAHKLEDEGLNIWIDYKSIDYGANILENILSSIEDSDMVLLFISEDYKQSLMAKKELISFFRKVIIGNQRWKIIKLDNVEPNDIYYTLGDYKYFDVQNEDVNDLIKSIKNDIISIQKDKMKV